MPEGAEVMIAEINGSPSVILRHATQVLGVLNFSITEGRIQAIHHLFNTDKLGAVGNALE